MIKYALACDQDHSFEGWFSNSADYDDQLGRGLVECPLCGSRGVAKQIMAPRVAGTKAKAAPSPEPKAQEMMMEALGQVRRYVEETFDDVGDTFAREARAIHEGSSEDRGIYGQATPAEVRGLTEDGIRVAPLPPAPKAKSELN
ncbi:MAG: hypothetical protein JWO33_2774 [Caulobacteraceae bacterium]|nr:hypothetical protein [Caulobacteraceae bacterium]